MKRYIYLPILFSILCACQQNTKEKDEHENDSSQSTVTLNDAQLKSIDLQYGTIEQKVLPKEISVNGKLDVPPQNLITIAAPMGGFIKATEMLEGMNVKKGDVIVTLENQEYIQLQQDYLDSKSKLELYEAEYERQKLLASENINAGKTLQQAKSNFESTKAILAGLVAKLKMININPKDIENGNIRSTINLYAPINATITRVNVNIGQFVNNTDEIVKMVNTEHLHAELYIFEKDISVIRIGQKVQIHFPNNTQTRTATVYLVGKEITDDRTIRVHCHFDKEDKDLVPGMFVSARIGVTTDTVSVLPSQAITNFEGEQFIFIQKSQNEFLPVAVETGGSYQDYVEVKPTSNVSTQSKIVIKGSFNLMGLWKNTEEE